jgi:hypothetical protein
MQSQNNFIEKREITMNLSVVADPVIEDPVIEDPVIEDPVIDTVQTNFDSKIQRSNFIEPHSESEDEIEDKLVDKIPLKHFGTFELELKKVQISGEIKTINIMIDNSGSMDRRCSDGNTQLEQVIFVTERVLRFIEENCPEGNISVSVKTFSTRVRTIFEATPVLSSNLDELIGKLKKIYSDDETDIGKALKEMHTTGPEQYNIFLSDGDATCGIKRPLALADCVDKNAINTFIGFGTEHNPKIFAALSNTKNSSYYFIATIEKSRNAYAEILERILYKCLDAVTIEITGGKLYNYKTNTLESELYVGNMSGSMKKTFHLYSETPEEIAVVVKSNGVVQQVVNFEGNRKDLKIAFYRQKTLELLYKSTNGDKHENYLLKEEMKSIMAEIKAYMKANGMMDNVQLKYLCNDIAIVYQTLGTRDAFMYSCSRQASNGDERMHNVIVDRNANNPDSDSDWDSDSDDDDDVQRACAPSNYDDDDNDFVQKACFSSSKPKQKSCAPSNYHDDSDEDSVQKACAPSNYHDDSDEDGVVRACAPSNYHDDDDIDNFCITDDSPFTSENVNTILKSFNDDEN